uniref:Uncharacterized protein n=1 Tax=Anguilla anguilla TaxID=7936 RepID=A0A0E9V2I1_ANGAN
MKINNLVSSIQFLQILQHKLVLLFMIAVIALSETLLPEEITRLFEMPKYNSVPLLLKRKSRWWSIHP